MHFSLTEEQSGLRDVLRAFLQERASTTFARSALDGRPDPGIWRSMASELGLQSLIVPEAFGGQGAGPVEQALVMEELGRVVFPGPYLATSVLAVPLLVAVGGDVLLDPLLAGERVATLAVADDGGAWDGSSVRVLAVSAAEDGLVEVTGAKQGVVGAAEADDLLLVARHPQTAGDDGLLLVAVAADAPGVTVTPLDTIDPTRPQADVELAGVTGRVVAPIGAAVLMPLFDRTVALLAAELVGVAQQCLDLTVRYLREREQFGVPIGSFQALRHRCADLLVEVELARSAAYVAVCRATEDDLELLALAASSAFWEASDTAVRLAREMVQLHGGIGFTWEHDAHLFARRVQATRALLGGVSAHRARLWTFRSQRAEVIG